MRDFIVVALGGMIGSVARHAANVGLIRLGAPTSWPLATLFVNLVGCFGIGLIAAAAKRWQGLDTQWELAVRVGILGGLRRSVVLDSKSSGFGKPIDRPLPVSSLPPM